ncbi:thiol:disulfide interchange protein TlpA [Methylobacterium haplocladii]|uniref:Thiol:disulfide interchange protein TlpA n=1 Tax=Methylobacterium haplocladii TaxID=1176176 RepID=A0A512IL59_9HYPH|nr:TlpA disulfide reductase family protein [Methylobacterium haplocladii]GEO98441.1 thiol:disulfide interchange protein TlpA [Methylobacterium haplocladii]GJD83069.1 Thiol:disulfide interchange protein TlpA [Methylobacterium haplocladii]GLS60899.1 thiol:disulfide interchange protein TlpA [Methylobacterium haplocladii]
MANRAILVAGGVAAALLAGLALYGTGSKLGNLAAAEPCADAAATVARIAPLARGDVAALDTKGEPKPGVVLQLTGPDGAATSLAALKGKALLVNLWATWCAPCKAEMPALDRLQGELGGKKFQVVAINVETRNLDKPPKWLADNNIRNLAYYGDPAGKVLPAVQQQTGTIGLPTTLLIDAHGCEVGVMKGPADWAGAEGKALITALIGGGA